MRKIQLLTLLSALLVSSVTLAQTEIHKCTDADGSVVYSQLPCKDEVPAKAEEPAEPEAIEEPASTTGITEFVPPDTLPEDAATRENGAACKKRYRDEIDAIDAEIRREYTKDKDAEYKQRLLALTRKLRAC